MDWGQTFDESNRNNLRFIIKSNNNSSNQSKNQTQKSENTIKGPSQSFFGSLNNLNRASHTIQIHSHGCWFLLHFSARRNKSWFWTRERAFEKVNKKGIQSGSVLVRKSGSWGKYLLLIFNSSETEINAQQWVLNFFFPSFLFLTHKFST